MTTFNESQLGEAIALSSPSGHMSRRALAAAQKRITAKIFEGIDLRPQTPQVSLAERLRHQALELRGLAARGMKPRAYALRAAQLEAEADAIDSEGTQP